MHVACKILLFDLHNVCIIAGHTPVQERRSDPGLVPFRRSATEPPSLSNQSLTASDDRTIEHEMSSEMITQSRQQLQSTQGVTEEGELEHQTITSPTYACEQSTPNSFSGDQSQPSYSFRPNSHPCLHGSQETYSRPTTSSRDSLLCSSSSQPGSQVTTHVHIHITPLSDEFMHSSLSLSSGSADSRSQSMKSRRHSVPDIHSLSRQHSKEGLCDAQQRTSKYATLHERAEEDVISNDERGEAIEKPPMTKPRQSPAQSVRSSRSAALSSDEGSPRPTQSPKNDSRPQVSERQKSWLQESRHKPEAYTDEKSMIHGEQLHTISCLCINLISKLPPNISNSVM